MPTDPIVAEPAPYATAAGMRPAPAGTTLGDVVASPALPGVGLAIAGALALVLLAMMETLQALIAPWGAPTRADWAAASAEVRAGFRAGDLIVAAPAWADPILRMSLGDLITIPMAARMDDARYGRVWEVSQRGAHADEARGATIARRRVGALTVRLVERPAAAITYDFLAHWTGARVTRFTPAARVSLPCPWQGDRFACPGGGFLHRELVEVDTRIRSALMAPPEAGAIIAVEFPTVTLGKELVLSAGLHDVWARKYGRGTVNVEIWIAGQPVASATIGNRSGWHALRVDTAARDGQVAPVRVQISSPQPSLRNLAFAAEARR